ncbi:MAG: hypothetical protein ACR2P5_09320 [Gammaproteobacteria bacterium]
MPKIKPKRAPFLHPQETEEHPWKFLPAFLLAAFIARAIVALSGDFVLHPDEIMQYLEPARRLVFGSGILYWEYFYGARSWLIPGIVAGVLWLCKIIGLGAPQYYIPAVKLLFCLISLAIPWGMYVFSRRHWGEKTARCALVLGAFWYELAAFAHKPFTELSATALLICLLAAVAPFARDSSRRRWFLAGLLGALAVAVRLQYAPPVGLILLAAFFRAEKTARLPLCFGFAFGVFAIGVLEALTWGLDAAIFHSYYVNLRMNLIVGAARAGESSILHMPVWLLLAGGGLILAALFGVFENFRRRGFVFALLLLILLPHMLQNHREYRFIFALIPLWLLLFADFTAVRAGGGGVFARRLGGALLSAAALVSLAGIFNQIPFQERIYRGFSLESGQTNFLFNQDPAFEIYRLLAKDESARGVADFTRPYFNTGGYYYLGKNIPFYDSSAWTALVEGEDAPAHASHIITAAAAPNGGRIISSKDRAGRYVPNVATSRGYFPPPVFVHDLTQNALVYWDKIGRRHPQPEYENAGQFGALSLWKTKTPLPVRDWEGYTISSVRVLQDIDFERRMLKKIIGRAPPVPSAPYGIEFKDE